MDVNMIRMKHDYFLVMWLFCYISIRNYEMTELFCLILQTRGSLAHVSLSCIDSRHRGSNRIRLCRQGPPPEGNPIRVCRRSDYHQAGTWMEHIQVNTCLEFTNLQCILVKNVNLNVKLFSVWKWKHTSDSDWNQPGHHPESTNKSQVQQPGDDQRKYNRQVHHVVMDV